MMEAVVYMLGIENNIKVKKSSRCGFNCKRIVAQSLYANS